MKAIIFSFQSFLNEFWLLTHSVCLNYEDGSKLTGCEHPINELFAYCKNNINAIKFAYYFTLP